MTRAELLEENRALREALRSIFEQVAELLEIEVTEDLEVLDALE
jgi:hypothetical protein